MSGPTRATPSEAKWLVKSDTPTGYEITGSYEWVIPNFAQLAQADKQFSPTFIIGAYSWRLLCFPRQNAAPHRHVSLFLELKAAKRMHMCLLPRAYVAFIVKNHRNPEKNVKKVAEHRFESSQVDWGFSQMLPLADINTETGFLRADGALVVRVDVSLPQPMYPAQVPAPGAGSLIASALTGLSTDLLALLDNPGSTADLAIVATGPEPAAAAEGDAATVAAGPISRRFEVHRNILAARCPYFATHFSSGLGDSGARELTLPDTDPDALAVLLRFMYGGRMQLQSREQVRSCMVLADRLLLPQAVELLREHLLSTYSASTLVADLLYAAGLWQGAHPAGAGAVEVAAEGADIAAGEGGDEDEEGPGQGSRQGEAAGQQAPKLRDGA